MQVHRLQRVLVSFFPVVLRPLALTKLDYENNSLKTKFKNSFVDLCVVETVDLWGKMSCHHLNQSDANLKYSTALPPAFSRAFSCLRSSVAFNYYWIFVM